MIYEAILKIIDKPVQLFMYRFNIDKWSCRHCNGNGICTNGNSGVLEKYSCNSCMRKEYNDKDPIHKIVKCSICNGTGRVNN